MSDVMYWIFISGFTPYKSTQRDILVLLNLAWHFQNDKLLLRHFPPQSSPGVKAIKGSENTACQMKLIVKIQATRQLSF